MFCLVGGCDFLEDSRVFYLKAVFMFYEGNTYNAFTRGHSLPENLVPYINLGQKLVNKIGHLFYFNSMYICVFKLIYCQFVYIHCKIGVIRVPLKYCKNIHLVCLKTITCMIRWVMWGEANSQHTSNLHSRTLLHTYNRTRIHDAKCLYVNSGWLVGFDGLK